MAELSQIESALRKAHAAGDVEGARRLANAYRTMKAQQPTEPAIEQPAPMEQPAQIAPQPEPQSPQKRLQLPPWTPRARPVIDSASKEYPLPSNLDVAQNAAVKGLAGVPDMVLNTPTNLYNLGKAGIGTITNLAGRPDLSPELTQNPDIARELLTSAGLINPEYEPQTPSQRMLDTAVQSATGSALTGGAGGLKTLASNVAGGALGGAAAQAGTEAGHPLLGLAAGLLVGGGASAATNKATGATVNTVKQQQNALLNKNFEEARKAGIAIPVSQSNPDSLIANTVDILSGGRPRMQQAASIKNARKATEAAAKDLGLDVNSPITPDTIDGIITKAIDTGYDPVRKSGVVKVSENYNNALDKLTEQTRKAKQGFQGYDDSGVVKTIDQLRTNEFDAESGISMIRQLRADANKAYSQGDSQLGKALKGASKAIEDEIETHLGKTGQEELLNKYREARKTIAKANTVSKALNESTGNVSAQKLGRQLDKGVPLSGELRDIALASKLPGSSLSDTKYATTGASQLEALAALGTAGATGNFLFAGVPVARGLAREAALSPLAGKLLGTPSYGKAALTPQNRNALVINTANIADTEQ